MPANYRRIHIPKPLHDEIVKFVESSQYETVAELCREASRLLVEHHKLREKYA
jgi:Arc/MetJ-type ribon-helix-helix transcriptional regulator